MKNLMRIGELAARADVTPRTVRHYEAIGLIPRGAREGAGQHHYPEETVARLIKINQLKSLGLSLEEIGEVVELYFSDVTGVRAKQKVLAMLKAHLADVDRKAADLLQVRSDLAAHIRRFELWLQNQKSGS